jgi:hypothetical protein
MLHFAIRVTPRLINEAQAVPVWDEIIPKSDKRFFVFMK